QSLEHLIEVVLAMYNLAEMRDLGLVATVIRIMVTSLQRLVPRMHLKTRMEGMTAV
ncbi:Hypothetical predicted protein, partial [Scomber scombrus]